MANAKRPSHLFVRGSRVVGRAYSTAEAIKLAKLHPDAEICMPAYENNIQELKKARKAEIKESRLKSNPIARHVIDECTVVLEDIEEAVKTSLPSASLDDNWHGGFVWTSDVQRAATNEECAFLEGNISLAFCADLRRDLPSQLSQWLTRMAAGLPKMIQAIEEIQDVRNRSTIRRLISEKDLLKKMEAEGKCIGFGGKIVAKEQFDREMKEWLAEKNAA